MGESSFWYRPTRVVPDQRPLNGRPRDSCGVEGNKYHGSPAGNTCRIPTGMNYET